MSAVCPVCEAKQDAGLLCSNCCDRLERELGDVAAIVAELEVTISKQDRMGSAGKGAPARERNPVNWGASTVADDLQNTLTSWVRDLSNDQWRPASDVEWVARAKAQPFIGPFHDHCWHPSCMRMRVHLVDKAEPAMRQVSLYLLGHIPEIRRHPAVVELVDEITEAINRARRIVDRPADKQYLGQCLVPTPDEEGREVTCLEDVYASRTASFAVCKVCGVTHDVAERRAKLLEDAEDRLFTTQEAAQIIGSYGEMQISESTIRSYVSTGQISYHGKFEGKSVIRMGDLMDVIRKQAAKPKGRKLRKVS